MATGTTTATTVMASTPTMDMDMDTTTMARGRLSLPPLLMPTMVTMDMEAMAMVVDMAMVGSLITVMATMALATQGTTITATTLPMATMDTTSTSLFTLSRVEDLVQFCEISSYYCSVTQTYG